MTDARLFPLNAWYAAAWSHEIKHELAARTICDKDVVLYRRTRRPGRGARGCVLAPAAAALHGPPQGRRGRLRLSRPRLQCGRALHLHAGPEDHQSVGLRARLSGRGAAIASSGSGPAIPALADPAKIPDFHWNDGTDWVGEGGTFYSLKCDYRLVIDNLMDLTHETYVHAGSIGDEAITSAPFDVTHTDRTATVTRWMIDIEPPPFWAKQLGRPGHVRPLADHPLPGALDGRRRRRRGAHRDRRAAGRPLPGRQRRLPRRHHAGDGEDLPLFLELRREPSARTTSSSPATSTGRTSTTARASTIRTTWCSRRSRRRSTRTRACPSTTSTSMPAPSGPAG